MIPWKIDFKLYTMVTTQLIQICSEDWADVYDTHNIGHRTEPLGDGDGDDDDDHNDDDDDDDDDEDDDDEDDGDEDDGDYVIAHMQDKVLFQIFMDLVVWGLASYW